MPDTRKHPRKRLTSSAKPAAGRPARKKAPAFGMGPIYLQAILDANQEATLLIDRKGIVVSCNLATVRRLGLEREDLIGRCVYEVLAPAVAAQRRSMADQVFRTGDAADFEDEHKGRIIVNHLQPVVDARGKVTHVAVVSRDVTAQRAHEKALRLSQAKYRSLFESSPDGILLTRPDGTIHEANPAACAMLGMSAEDILRAGRAGILQADDRLAAALQERERTGRFGGELTYIKGDGTPLPVEVESVVIPQPGPGWSLVIFRDITARLQTRFEQETTFAFLELANACSDTRALVEAAVTFFQERSGCEAVGIRLKEGDDYPFHAARGFPAEFMEAGNPFCAPDPKGDTLGDGQGRQVLDCMCGCIIRGNVDPTQPFFTASGTLWTNQVDDLLPAATVLGSAARPGERCLCEGFHSLALIPVNQDGQCLGLLHMASREAGRFTPAVIATWERLAGHLAGALAKLGAEAEVRAAEELYRCLVETAYEGIWAADAGNRTIFINRRMADMMGYAPEEMIGLPVEEFLFPEDVAPHREQVDARRRGTSGQYERRGRRKDGSEIWTIASATPLKDAEGRYAGSFAMFTDITARKRAEESSRLFERMASGSIDSLALIGRDYVYRGVNQALLNRFSLSQAEVVGRHAAEIVGAEVFEKVLRPPLDACLSGKTVSFAEWLTFPVLGRRFLEVNYAPYREPDGAISGVIVNGRDITERKQSEQILHARLRLSEAAPAIAFEELLQRAVDEAELLTDSRIGFIHLLDADQRTLSLQAWSSNTLQAMCTAERKAGHYNMDEAGVWVDCIRERRPVFHNDYPSLPQRRGLPAGHPAVRRDLVVPILRNDRIVAIMGVGNKEEPYDLHDAATLSSLGTLLWDIVLRKKAEEQVAIQALVLEQAQDRVTLADLTGRILYVNRAQCEALSRNPDDLMGQPYYALGYAPLGGVSHQELVARTLRFGKWRGEVLHRNADGSESIVDCRTSLVRDVSGKAVAICGVGTDVTERRRIDAALRDSEARYRALVEMSPVAVLVVVDGQCAYANPATLKLLGAAEFDQISRIPLLDLVAPESRDAIVRRLQAAGAGETNSMFEWEAIRVDNGARVTVESTSLPMRFAGRQAVMAIGQDITERRRVQDALRESALFLTEAHRIARMGGWKANPRTDFLEWTEGVHDIIETPREYAPPLSIGLKFYMPAYIPILEERIERCLDTGDPFTEECEVETAMGNRLWTEVRGIKPVTEGARTYVIGTFQDITERKQAEIEKRESERRLQNAREEERRRIAREVHDELGQSLTALKIDLAWLRQKVSADHPFLPQKLESMDRMVASTLETVQRVSSELRPGILDALGLTAAVEWLVRDFEKRTGIECFLAVEPEEMPLEPNLATNIFRILQEALTNVARHSRATWVRVHLQQKPAAIDVRVIDNGVGITDEQAARPDSLGLLGMRERIAVAGGRLSIQGLPGEGTLIHATISWKEKRP